MRIRHAATALVALGSTSVCALGATLVLQDREDDARESELRSSSWSVQASTDFGTTWTAPISTYGGHFPVRVDTAGLRNRSAYQPLTLRTSVDSRSEAHVMIGEGMLVDGDPTTAADVRIRAVTTSGGACAAPTFTSGTPSILAGDGIRPEPVDAATADEPLVLPAATRTTPGAPVTVCLELSMDSASPAPDSVLMLAWPIEITRADAGT
ncbi:hypothetical protein [Dietzia psychralcaliphila]|uniref:Ribosomally synthesized peptide with SipW-like signal peptide n=1 Tax=Dietzia psychralcaliphila TaxID=139021 RepID=A0AAD0NP71_9ACTN|nr:hypothetical protein [Dietzia psychralcaliphila]AWH96552.1 hypothetical protein A6048_14825 [Dietzia psychralcaliphila]PTM90276.1 hypothetical protein C8N39_10128 [Dietzia psychralcaliphila]